MYSEERQALRAAILGTHESLDLAPDAYIVPLPSSSSVKELASACRPAMNSAGNSHHFRYVRASPRVKSLSIRKIGKEENSLVGTYLRAEVDLDIECTVQPVNFLGQANPQVPPKGVPLSIKAVVSSPIHAVEITPSSLWWNFNLADG